MDAINFHEICSRAAQLPVSAYSSVIEDELNDQAFEACLHDHEIEAA